MVRWKKWVSVMVSAAIAVSGLTIPQKAEASGTMVTDEELSDVQVEAPETWGVTPNEEQLWYMKSGLAAFCHFGPNTFNNVEWGQSYGTRLPSDIFTLTEKFDAEGLVLAVKNAGFSRIMLTAKHHDGFCLWDSALTDYDIGSTNYGGDILEEISDACTKYNLDMGLYLSPWDIHEDKYGCFGDNNTKSNSAGYTDYNELYIDSIKEICTAKKADGSYKYGNNNPDRRSDRFVEWWMDGAQGDSNIQTFNWKGILDAIHETNPNCQVFGTHAAVNGINGDEDVALASTGGIHWIGNENGVAAEETWAKVNKGSNYENLIVSTDGTACIKGLPEGNQWSVPEVDTKMLAGWFWRDSAGDETAKTESELADLYFRTVGHGAALLLNLSPNKTGAVGEEQLSQFVQLGENIKETFDEDFTKAEGVTVSATSVWGNSKEYSPVNVLDEIPDGEMYDETYWAPAEGESTGSLEINLGGLKTFDVVSIEEYIQKGQAISSWSVEYKDITGQWKEFASGTTISAKRLCRSAAVEGTAVRINILSTYADTTPMICNVGVFKASEGFEAEAEGSAKLPTNLDSIPITEFTLGNGWTYENENTSAWAGVNGEASFTFTGTQAWIFGTKDPGHGTAEVYIDDVLTDTIDTQDAERNMNALLYTTPELAYGTHTVRLVCKTSALGVCEARYTDGSGIFEMKQSEATLLYGGTTEIEIIRTKGSHGEVTIPYTTESAGAEQGVNYVNLTGKVTFADGETSKKIVLTGLENNRSTDGKDFFFTLLNTGTASIGTNSYTHVTLYTVNADNILALCEAVDTEAYTGESAAAFEQALEVLKAYKNSTLATEEAVKEAAKAAFSAKNALVLRDGYTEADPFTLPVRTGESKTIEAEKFILDASGAANADNYVRVDEKDYGTVVNWFEEGNRIVLPFYAAKAGTYKVTASYRSGRVEGRDTPNAFNWSGTNVESGSQDVYGEENAVADHTAEFTINVTSAGAGELVFTADSKGAPVIDKFEIQYTGTETIAVESVTLNQTEMTLTAEMLSGILMANVQPFGADNKALTFTSSNPSVAAVDAYGVVKGLKRGTAVITVTTADGAKTAQCTVTVNLPEEQKIPDEQGKQEEKPSQVIQPAPTVPQIKVGMVYDSGNYSYKVTSVENLTAEVVGVKKASLTKIAVYNTVSLGGKSYKVTSIAASAFKNNKKVTSAVIGKNVQVIGKNAFAGCVKLKKVTVKGNGLKQIGAKAFFNCKKLTNLTIKSKVLKKVGKNAFKGIYKKAVIKVPSAKLKAYTKLLAKKGQSKTVKIKK